MTACLTRMTFPCKHTVYRVSKKIARYCSEVNIWGLTASIETCKDSIELLRFSALFWYQEIMEKIVFEERTNLTQNWTECHKYFYSLTINNTALVSCFLFLRHPIQVHWFHLVVLLVLMWIVLQRLILYFVLHSIEWFNNLCWNSFILSPSFWH